MKLRRALLLGTSLLLCDAALRAAPGQLPGPATGFVAPDAPLILTRELRRELNHGKELVSRRSYRIRFVRDGLGYRVEGQLVGAEVDAPPELAMLAALERSRRDDGLFPMRLGADGMIVEQNGVNDPESFAKARALVAGALSRAPMEEGEKAAAGAMVGTIGAQVASGGGGNWPVDLFRPAEDLRSNSRPLALPGGRSGLVTVTTSSKRAGNGMLAEFHRRVVTELDGSRRESLETWTLEMPR